MKRITYLCLATVLALGVYSCQSFKGATASVTPNPLEVHADSVRATVKVSIPPKSGIKKGTVYQAQFVVKNNSDSTKTFPMGSLRASSDDYPDIAKQGASKAGPIASVFVEDMSSGRLVSENSYTRKGKTVTLPNYTLAQCCITTSRLVNNAGGYQYTIFNNQAGATSPFEPKGKPIAIDARFQFPKNIFDIQPNQYKRDDIKAIGEFLKKRYTANSVTIAGFASPEGAFARNKFLSIQRSRVVQRWLSEELKKEGYKSYLDSSFFHITTTSEDWDGFKANLDNTPYSEDVKRQVIEIVSAGYDEDTKEQKIMSLVGGANRVESILAPLRRATIHLDAATKVRTAAQLDSIGNSYFEGRTSADSLKSMLAQEDYLYTLSRVSDSDKRIKLTTEYTKAYPDDYRGFNDLGALQANAGKLDAAFDNFTTASQKKANDPLVLANLAQVQLSRGNFAEAFASANTSFQASPSPTAAFVLGVISEKHAQYTKAAQYFDQATGIKNAKYNSGLSKLLMNDLAGAKTSLDGAVAEDKTNALAYYVEAIVGARSGDTNLLITNLKSAVQADGKLKDKAAGDLEFRQYSKTPEFKAAAGL